VGLAGLHEAAAVVADAVEPAGRIALGLDVAHAYFFLLFALPLPLAPFDLALAAAFSSAAHSRP
jgi:hypothetical protein